MTAVKGFWNLPARLLPFRLQSVPNPPMSIKRTTRRFTAWIALFAILLGAVVPALTHALSRPGDGEERWVEVCTVAGTRLVAVDEPGDQDRPGGADLFPGERCAFCATHGGAPALPTLQAMPFVLKGSADEFPWLYFHAPRPLFAWAPAHPRAPPFLA